MKNVLLALWAVVPLLAGAGGASPQLKLAASSFRIAVAHSASAGSGVVEEISEAEKRSMWPGHLWARAKPFAAPDMFRSESGRRITTREEWERRRRPEIRWWFETHMHGVRPVERPDALTFTPLGADWKSYMDFADRHGWRSASSSLRRESCGGR